VKGATQKVLDQLYLETVKELQRIILLDDQNMPHFDTETEKQVEMIVWLPVARVCVVEILRPILTAYTPVGKVCLTEKLLTSMWRTHVTPEEIARSSGLQSLVDTELAMAIAAKVIVKSDVFKTPQTLEVDYKTIVVNME